MLSQSNMEAIWYYLASTWRRVGEVYGDAVDESRCRAFETFEKDSGGDDRVSTDSLLARTLEMEFESLSKA